MKQGASNADMRAESRFPAQDSAVLTILVDGSPISQARIVDISKAGIGLIADREIDTGTWIKVQFGTTVIFGVVRYSRKRKEQMYRIGMASDTVVTIPPARIRLAGADYSTRPTQ